MNLNPPQVAGGPKQTFANVRYNTGEIVMLLIFIGLIGFYLIKPKYAEYQKRKEELTATQVDFTKLKDTENKISQLHRELQTPAIKDDLLLLDEAVPLEARASRIYILMESLVGTSGMTLGSMSVDPINSLSSVGYTGTQGTAFDAERKLATATISLNLTGGIDQFLGFLKILENNPRIFDITIMEIGGEQPETLSYKLVIKTFAFGK